MAYNVQFHELKKAPAAPLIFLNLALDLNLDLNLTIHGSRLKTLSADKAGLPGPHQVR